MHLPDIDAFLHLTFYLVQRSQLKAVSYKWLRLTLLSRKASGLGRGKKWAMEGVLLRLFRAFSAANVELIYTETISSLRMEYVRGKLTLADKYIQTLPCKAVPQDSELQSFSIDVGRISKQNAHQNYAHDINDPEKVYTNVNVQTRGRDPRRTLWVTQCKYCMPRVYWEWSMF